jgi:tetratricopeptide (TPR) repeat protein
MSVDLEDLHREASGHYLKGEFVAAIEAWRQVLDLKPDDERAREGIRLCEQLDGGVDPSRPVESASPPPAEATSPPPVEATSPPPVEATSPPPVEATSPPPVEAASPPQVESTSSPQGMDDAGELDLEVECDLSAPEPVGADAESPGGDGESMLDLSQLGEQEATGTEPVASAPASEPVEAPESSDDGAAADELQRRIDALLTEARSLADQGVFGPALGAVERVLILDEENEEAIALRERLQEATAEPVPSDDAPALDLDLESVDGSADAPAVAQSEAADAPSEPATDAEQPTSQETATGPSAAAGGKQRTALTLPAWLQDRRVMLGAGVVLVIVAVAAALMMVGGGDEPNLQPIATPDTPEAEQVPGSNEQPVPAEPDPTPGGTDMEALMRDAESAFEAENYAAAVIAYDQVLKQVPDHAEASVKMKVAAERYRAQQERQERWDTAIAAFDEGNYAEALRAFYRMPKDEYEADIDRYKVNGWYNLGVAALQAKDCRRAIKNFEEARALAPHDEGVLGALELAELCHGTAVLQDVRRLQYRALND